MLLYIVMTIVVFSGLILVLLRRNLHRAKAQNGHPEPCEIDGILGKSKFDQRQLMTLLDRVAQAEKTINSSPNFVEPRIENPVESEVDLDALNVPLTDVAGDFLEDEMLDEPVEIFESAKGVSFEEMNRVVQLFGQTGEADIQPSDLLVIKEVESTEFFGALLKSRTEAGIRIRELMNKHFEESSHEDHTEQKEQNEEIDSSDYS